MTASDLDLRLQRFRSRRDEYPHALASALIEAGRSSDALEVIHLGLLDDEANLELLTLEGRAYYVQGDLQEAQRSLLRAAKVDPRHKEPYRWLAQVLIERGDAVRAVQVLERAIGLDPNDAALRQSYARAQRMAGAAGARPPSARPSAPRKTPSSPPAASTPARPKSSPPARRSSPPEPLTAREPVRERPRASEPRASIPAQEPAPRPKSSTPSSLGPAARQPENQNGAGKRGAISDLVARASALSSRTKPAPHDLVAEDLLREPLTEPGGTTAPQRLPYERELEREDESPTTAVEVPEEVRSWLRTGRPRPSERPQSERPRPLSERPRPSSERPRPISERPPQRPTEQVMEDDDDDESSVPTSIVNASQELDALRRRESLGPQGFYAPSEDSESTLIAHTNDILAEPGQAEPPEQVLQMLQSQGVFETSNAPPTVAQGWLAKGEVPREGTNIRRALGIAWGVAVLLGLVGYYFFTTWVDQRRADAAALVEKARGLALDGQHESLLSAERVLSEARTLDPKSEQALGELVFVSAARCIDDGNGEFGALRNALGRAQQAQLETPVVQVAKVLVQPSEQRQREIDGLLALADKAAPNDARASYLAARIAQHAGQVEATKKLLARAVALEPSLSLAQVALGEQLRAAGEFERATEAFQKALGPDHKELRAELWLSLLETKSEDTAALQTKLDELAPRVDKSSDADKLLAASVRAFAAQGAGEADKGKQALKAGSQLRVDDPELLALLSEQALRAGDRTLAYRAAKAASSAGGDAPRFEALVAAAGLTQGEGDATLTSLANIGEGHGALALARAGAALLSDSREALEAAKKELASYRLSSPGKEDAEAGALLMRVDLRLGASAESLLPAARAAASKSPMAATQLALAEAQLTAGQGSEALSTLNKAVEASSGSADAYYLMGRAQRLIGKPTEARASFERAVAIAPNHVEAQRALGRCLLEAGENDAALALFRALETTAPSSASLGIVEALLAKGNASEAASRFDALGANLRASAAAQLLLARLELARKKVPEALKTLEPLVAEDADSRTAESLGVYGAALLASDKLEPAAAAYDSALELDERDPDALIGRAQVALRANKADTAVGLLTRAEQALVQRTRPPSERALSLTLLGHAELDKNQNAAALDHLARAIALPGVQSEAYFWYGEALARAKSDKANEQYARYLSLEPEGAYAARAKKALAP